MNESIQRLREPAAWVLLGAAAASTVGGAMGGASWLGLPTVILVLTAVLLTVMAPVKSQRTFLIVLIGMILTAVGVLLGLITLIMGLFSGGSVLSVLSSLFHSLSNLAVVGLSVYFLFLIFSDNTLVPRTSDSAVPPMPPTGGQPGMAGMTGAHPAYTTGQGFPTGGQAPPAQPDPTNTGQGFATGAHYAAYGQTDLSQAAAQPPAAQSPVAQPQWPQNQPSQQDVQPNQTGQGFPTGGQPAQEPEGYVKTEQIAYLPSGQDQQAQQAATPGSGYPAAGYGQPDTTGGYPGYATGGQAPAAQPDPSQTGQGYTTGGYAGYQSDPSANYSSGAYTGYGQASQTGQGYATGGQYSQQGQAYSGYGQHDPAQTGQGYQTGGAAYQPYQNPSQTGQSAFGQSQPPQPAQPPQGGADLDATMVHPPINSTAATQQWPAVPGPNDAQDASRGDDGMDLPAGWYRDEK